VKGFTLNRYLWATAMYDSRVIQLSRQAGRCVPAPLHGSRVEYPRRKPSASLLAVHGSPHSIGSPNTPTFIPLIDMVNSKESHDRSCPLLTAPSSALTAPPAPLAG